VKLERAYYYEHPDGYIFIIPHVWRAESKEGRERAHTRGGYWVRLVIAGEKDTTPTTTTSPLLGGR